jgi:hypothetical protein
VTTPELELTISEAVKQAVPGCEDFVGVIVEYANPRSYLDPNWAITGIRYGAADRKITNEALAIVERMKRECCLAMIDLRRTPRPRDFCIGSDFEEGRPSIKTGFPPAFPRPPELSR